MKHILYKIGSTVLVLTLLCTSCSDEFLETTPTESISQDTATSTVTNLNVIINGIHRSLYQRYESQQQGGLGCLMIAMDVLGEDYVMTGAANGWFNGFYRWIDHRNENDIDNEFPFDIYYGIIRNANSIIINIDNAVGAQEEKNAVLGQALFYRAFSHYQLVQLYGERYKEEGNNQQPGIPLRIDLSSDPLPRASVEDVYVQVNRDLDDAIAVLTDSRNNNSHINRSVALGLKARVALTQGRWQIAVDNAQEARDGFPLMSNSDYFSGFNDFSNQEWMWGSDIVEDQTIFFANYGAYISRNFSSSNIRGNPKAINSALYDQIPSTDIRSKVFDPTGEHDSLPGGITISSRHRRREYTSQKFLSAGTGDSRLDVPYMRAAEMYLIEAEALARLGQDTNAAQVLFELASNRDSEYTLSSNTGQDLIEEIWIQRRWELWGEGFRFLDLKRLNLPLDRTGANHSTTLTQNILEVPAGDPRWQWAIPIDAINANPLLTPNP